MKNIIKKINLPWFSEALENTTKMNEVEINKIYSKIGANEEFNKLCFHHDILEDSYYYQSKDEKQLTLCLEKYINKDELQFMKNNHGILIDYGKELYGCRDAGLIEFNDDIGSTCITKEVFYYSLVNEYLNQPNIIKRLIESSHFYQELSYVKKECIRELLIIAHKNALEYLTNCMIEDKILN